MDLSGAYVWVLDTGLASAADLQRAEAVLSPDELSRLRWFRREADRRAYLLAHWLARCVLAQAAECAPQELCFANGPHGRPCVAAPPQAASLAFNLSHSARWVGVIVSGLGPIGLDIERVDPAIDPLDMAARILTLAETDALQALSPGERSARFFRLWTLKEAYLKARGLGLAGDPASFSFELPENGTAIFRPPPEDAIPWRFHAAVLDDRHYLAACYPATCGELHIKDGRALLRGEG